MSNLRLLDKALLILVGALFLWFFASSLSIAWQRPPSHDDALFASVLKNLLRGEGWSTSYGERIPFNPDLTAGPLLLLSAAPLMMAFGTASWVPALTGALVNISLTLLILWQLHRRMGHRVSVYLAVLLTLSLFAANDFKTFTGYYSCGLLFVSACLFIASDNLYSFRIRLSGFGSLAAVGFYIKPLILLSFLAAAPLVVLGFRQRHRVSAPRSCFWLILGFLLVFLPWHFYKTHALQKEGEVFRQSYQAYDHFFFEHHGSGIAQYNQATDKLVYLKKNIRKNHKILQRYLNNHLGIPLFALLFFIVFCSVYLLREFFCNTPSWFSPETLIVSAATVNLAWFLIFAFALTPGHAFFGVFLTIFLCFYLLSTRVSSNLLAAGGCLLIACLCVPAHKFLIQAYSFRQDDPLLRSTELQEAARFLDTTHFDEPLASCGYAGAPWRLLYLRQSSDRVLDCHHLLEDAIQTQSANNYQWGVIPDFVLVIEGFGLLAAAQSQPYVLEPILEQCAAHVVYRNKAVGLCKINGAALAQKLDPAKTKLALAKYQGWYRTRLEK